MKAIGLGVAALRRDHRAADEARLARARAEQEWLEAATTRPAVRLGPGEQAPRRRHAFGLRRHRSLRRVRITRAR